MSIKDLPAPLKSPVADPLFIAILNVTPPAPSAGRATPTWNEYLAAAARAIGAGSAEARGTTRAIGGGPSGTTEDANLREVARVSEERLLALRRKLTTSPDLKAEVDRTVGMLRAFESQAESNAASPPAQRGATPTKPPAETPP